MDPVEKKAYARGYAAGVKRRTAAREQALLDRIFIAVLPAAMTVTNWTVGDKVVGSTEEHIALASLWALEAYSKRPTV